MGNTNDNMNEEKLFGVLRRTTDGTIDDNDEGIYDENPDYSTFSSFCSYFFILMLCMRNNNVLCDDIYDFWRSSIF